MSSVTLTFQFDSIEQMTEFCARCAPHKTHSEVMNPSVTHPIAAPVNPARAETARQLDAAGVDPAQTEAPKRRGRPPKVKPFVAEESISITATAAVAPQTPEPAAAVEVAAVAVPTHEAVVAAQKALFDAKGAEACIQVLQRHGAARVSQVKPEQRAQFIKDCNDALAGGNPTAAHGV